MNNCASLQLLARWHVARAYVRKTTTYRNDIRRNKQLHDEEMRAKESLKL